MIAYWQDDCVYGVRAHERYSTVASLLSQINLSKINEPALEKQIARSEKLKS